MIVVFYCFGDRGHVPYQVFFHCDHFFHATFYVTVGSESPSRRNNKQKLLRPFIY